MKVFCQDCSSKLNINETLSIGYIGDTICDGCKTIIKPNENKYTYHDNVIIKFKILTLCEDTEGYMLENIKPYDHGHIMLDKFIQNIYDIFREKI